MPAMSTGIYTFIALWGLHVLSVIAAFTGLLFFIILAAKTFNASQMKSWAIWLMVGSTIVCLFTIGVMGHPWAWNMKSGKMMMMRGGMMNGMMEEMMEELEERKGSMSSEQYDGMKEFMEEMMDEAGDRPGMMDQ